MDCNLLWLGLIVLVSYTTQAMSGFGSTIIALTLGAHLYPIEELLPVLVPLDMVVNLYIATRYHRHVSHSLLFRSIIPAMGIGLLAGIITFQLIQGIILKKIFGFLVIVLSIRELYRLFKNISDQKVLSRKKSNFYILSAGVIHGIYASGGPLLIYALSRLDLSKSVFRSTLGAVWLIFSVFLTASYLISGTFTEDSLGFIAGLLPLIIIGIIIGEWLHHYIDEFRFKVFIFAVLLFAGLSISIS